MIGKVVTVVAAGVVGMSAGCGCPFGPRQALPTCQVTGGATLSSPAELGFGQTMRAGGGWNCLAGDGTCSRQPEINLTSVQNGASPPVFMAQITLPTVPSGVFDLTASNGACAPAAVSCVAVTNLAATSAGGVDVTFLSGTVDLHRSTATNLDATFALEFRAADGQAISVSDGHVSMTGCRVEQVCAE